jgi:hypothetical protein
MKYVLIAFALLLIPNFAQAHGGVEKTVPGSTTIFLNQSPLSPYVGETVSMTFVFEDSDTGKPLTGLWVELKVIDTYPNDASRDQVIQTEVFTTDANGAITFARSYDKANFFDIELTFPAPRTVEQTVGFLVQTRSAPGVMIAPDKQPQKAFNWNSLIIALGGGLVAGFAIGQYRKHEEKTKK